MAKATVIAPGDFCVIYCRVSSERQAKEDKGSLHAQERNGLTKAAELGLRVLYIEKDAESAWILDKRSKFQRVLADAQAGKFNVLIVDRMNRLTRAEDLGEYMQVMTLLSKAGVEVVFSTRDYDRDEVTGKVTALGHVTQFLDAYVSSQEQAHRRNQSVGGKRERVEQRQQPNPGSWPLYGYVWTDETKIRMVKDPGDSQRIVDRIWQSLLRHEHPTLRALAVHLNTEGVLTPREYRGVARSKNAAAGGPRWTATTIRELVHNPVYWGGDAQGMVPAFRWSTRSDETLIPAYAPAYVTREEALRVHARLTANQRFAPRNRRRDWGTLLHGGLAKCGECGWTLSIREDQTVRADGTRLLMYRCGQADQYGRRACGGGSISAETLDAAIEETLDDLFNGGHYLERLFAAWDSDAESAMGAARTLEQTLKDTERQVANALARIATYAPDDPLAAPLEAHARMLAETLPGLRKRHADALAAITRAHNNPVLREELRAWFAAWMSGYGALPRAKQREFLFAIGAEVRLWRAEVRSPRAIADSPADRCAACAARRAHQRRGDGGCERGMATGR